MFDRSPLGLNHWLGFRFRCMLGRHIFRHLGKHVKIFHNVEFTYGYNLTIEDSCTIHKNVMLDDRGEIILHEGTSVSDYANIYSHTHNINHQADVTNKLTELGPTPASPTTPPSSPEPTSAKTPCSAPWASPPNPSPPAPSP